MATKGRIAEIARAAGLTRAELLQELFQEHHTVSAVARVLDVSHSSVHMALLREGLEIHTTLERVPYLRKRSK